MKIKVHWNKEAIKNRSISPIIQHNRFLHSQKRIDVNNKSRRSPKAKKHSPGDEITKKRVLKNEHLVSSITKNSGFVKCASKTMPLAAYQHLSALQNVWHGYSNTSGISLQIFEAQSTFKNINISTGSYTKKKPRLVHYTLDIASWTCFSTCSTSRNQVSNKMGDSEGGTL